MNNKHDELITAAEKTHVFSQKHEQKMAAIFEAARQTENITKGDSTGFPKKKSKTIIKRVCLIAAVIVVLSTVATASFWDDLRYWITEHFDVFAEMDANDHQNVVIEEFFMIDYELPEDWESCWVPEYLPNGYDFDSISGSSSFKTIYYSNSYGELLELYQHHGVSDLQQDIEGNAKNVQIGHSTGYYVEKQIGETVIGTLLWNTEDTSYKISGVITLDEMVKTAESLVLIEQ